MGLFLTADNLACPDNLSFTEGKLWDKDYKFEKQWRIHGGYKNLDTFLLEGKLWRIWKK